MDQPRDERSLNRHGCLLTAMLVIAAASRDFWIRRLESLHIDQAAARETVPGRQRMHRRTRLPLQQDHRSDGLGVNDPVGRRRGIKAFVSRCVCGLQCPLWVIGGPRAALAASPLIPQHRTFGEYGSISVSCQKAGIANASRSEKVSSSSSVG
jgi:hypothetical protein